MELAYKTTKNRFVVNCFNEKGFLASRKEMATEADRDQFVTQVRELCPEWKITVVDLKTGEMETFVRLVEHAAMEAEEAEVPV